MIRHIRLTGSSRAGRQSWVTHNVDATVIARCHRRLRGPYTGVDAALAAILPDAARQCPDLVAEHHFEILYGMPELAEIIGPAPRMLASETPYRERTRFFAASMIRCMSQGIITFLVTYSNHRHAAGDPPLTVVFEEVHAADPTTAEFIALLLRRCDPAKLRVVVSGDDAGLPAELLGELTGADVIAAPDVARPPGPPRTEADLAAAYVAGHCTSDDPAEIRAYERATPAVRAGLHDEQADLIEASASPGERAGALAYHREHGSDPSGAGSRALAQAQRYCVEAGFSAAVVDLGMRGRAVTDPDADQQRYCELTIEAAHALVPLGRARESMELYLELRARYTLPKVHMATSYAIAMLHTRFLEPRDHEAAIAWENNAAAIAALLPDPRERLVSVGFQENALALIEMHRGNLKRSLELVESARSRHDTGLGEGEWALHRSQLLFNSAKLRAALGDAESAYKDFTALIELDPYYTDYLCERAKIARKAGDLAAALADYDHAARLGPPLPELYYNRGTARLAAGDIDGALSDFSYVLDMEPYDIDTRLSRAELLLSTGDHDAAIADAEQGLMLHPAEPRLLCMKGTIHLERAEIPAAITALSAALGLDPEYPAALLNRAVGYHQAGQDRESAEDLTRLLDAAGDDPDILLNRGIAYRATGRPDLAAADFTRALGLPGADTAELLRELERCPPPAHVSAPAAAR